MRFLRMARVATAIFAYLVMLVFGIWPTGMWKRVRMATRHRFLRAKSRTEFETAADLRTRRSVNAAHNTEWGVRINEWILRPIIGFRIQVRAPRVVPHQIRTLPRIYIINHRSSLDAIILLVTAAILGDHDIRWVIARWIARLPFVGPLMRDTGYLVVVRRKDDPGMDDDARKRHNEALMDEFIRLAREDAVSVGIFPEGERFSGIAVEGAKREHVGELKGKPGFRKLCEHLPRHAIVSLTVVWPPVKAGKTVLDADAFVGQTVEVIVKFHPHVTANDADAFLESEWDEKDAMQNLSPADLGR